jgi:hypothetical protein
VVCALHRLQAQFVDGGGAGDSAQGLASQHSLSP